MRKLFPIILCILLSSSCGIVRLGSSDRLVAGPAIRDYTPHGIVEEHLHSCSVPGPSQRRVIVYLPANYYQTTQRYPVVYLLHGARGYETAWIRFGQVYQTADSLWREGKAVPCIIVMPNVNQYNDDDDYGNSRFKDAYESILEVDGLAETAFKRDVVDLIDSLYRTIPDRDHRAIAGLSIGGYQSIYFGANHPDVFGYIGAMSPYMYSIGRPSSYRWHFYWGLRRKMKKQFLTPPPGYFVYAGKWDMMRPATVRFHRFMERHGYTHQYTRYPGSHDWPNGWIEEFQDILQRVFKQDPYYENTVCNQ